MVDLADGPVELTRRVSQPQPGALAVPRWDDIPDAELVVTLDDARPTGIPDRDDRGLTAAGNGAPAQRYPCGPRMNGGALNGFFRRAISSWHLRWNLIPHPWLLFQSEHPKIAVLWRE